MASERADQETPAEATDRRQRFACSAIQKAVEQKFGNASAHGTFVVKLHWRAGRLEHVTIEDSAIYK